MSLQTDTSEETIGYAKRMLRATLGGYLFEGVTFAYFLGYDPWDGSLVYEGLVPGSTEHKLIEYVQKYVLQNDFLRSVLHKGPEAQDAEKLGIAGHCFLSNSYQYVGDLELYASDYREYDFLLGLRCCFYLPIFPVTADGDIDRANGGILVLASPNPYFLVPTTLSANAEAFAKQAANYQDYRIEHPTVSPETLDANARRFLDFDTRVTQELKEHLTTGSQALADNLANFRECVGSMRRLHNKHRRQAREYFEPHAPLQIAHQLKFRLWGREHEPRETRALVKAICAAIRDELQGHEFGDGDFDQYVRPESIASKAQVRAAKPALGTRAQTIDDCINAVHRILRCQWNSINAKGRTAPATHVDSTEFPSLNPAAGQEYARHILIVDELMRRVRSGSQSAESIAYELLVTMTPLADHLRKMGTFENVLLKTGRYRQHLIHMLQVYLLGVLILTSDDQFLRDFFNHLKNDSHWRLRPDTTAKQLQQTANATDVLDTWMLVACCHDIAYPVQECRHWLRMFFSSYVEHSVAAHMPLDVLGSLEILKNRRFHTYKSDLVKLHGDCANWLDRVFLFRLSDSSPFAPDHGVLSALLLMDEMDRATSATHANRPPSPPNSRCAPVMERLRELAQSDQDAYVATRAVIGDAIALHSSYMWRDTLSELDPTYLSPSQASWARDLHSRYKLEGEKFSVTFEKTPLAFLLGFCDVLQEYGRPRPTDEGDLDLYNLSLYVSSVTTTEGGGVRTVNVTMRHTSRVLRESANPEEVMPIPARTLRDVVRLLHQLGKERRGLSVRRPVRVNSNDISRVPEIVREAFLERGHATGPDLAHPEQRAHYIIDYLFDIAHKIEELRLFCKTFRSGTWRFGITFDQLEGCGAAEMPDVWWIDCDDACWDRLAELVQFGAQYRVWDTVYEARKGNLLWRAKVQEPFEKFIDLLHRSKAECIIDAGCGDGKYMVRLVNAGFCLVVGCDASEHALKSCRKRLRRKCKGKAGRYQLFRRPLEDLDLLVDDFDGALCTDVLVHNKFDTSVQILRNLCRYVKPGGQIAFNLCTDQEPVRKETTMIATGPFSAWYVPNGRSDRYYFEFYDCRRLYELLDRVDTRIRKGRCSVQRYQAHEGPHRGYREKPHDHDYWIVIFESPARRR